jgi:hypothetical protein
MSRAPAQRKKIHAPPDPRLAPFAGQLTIIERNGDSFIGIADLDTRVGWFRDA